MTFLVSSSCTWDRTRQHQSGAKPFDVQKFVLLYFSGTSSINLSPCLVYSLVQEIIASVCEEDNICTHDVNWHLFHGLKWQQKLDKVERRFHAEQSTYNLLKEKHASAVAAQRHYFSLVKLFQVSKHSEVGVYKAPTKRGLLLFVEYFFRFFLVHWESIVSVVLTLKFTHISSECNIPMSLTVAFSHQLWPLSLSLARDRWKEKSLISIKIFLYTVSKLWETLLMEGCASTLVWHAGWVRTQWEAAHSIGVICRHCHQRHSTISSWTQSTWTNLCFSSLILFYIYPIYFCL